MNINIYTFIQDSRVTISINGLIELADAVFIHGKVVFIMVSIKLNSFERERSTGSLLS